MNLLYDKFQKQNPLCLTTGISHKFIQSRRANKWSVYFSRTAFLITAISTCSAYATISCDVYGADPTVANTIIKKYAKRINVIEDAINKIYLNTQNRNDKIKLLIPYAEKKQKLMQQIKDNEHLLYVDIETTYYPEDQTSQTTIDVIPKNHPENMRFIPTAEYSDPKPKDDIINTMINFKELVINLINQQEVSPHMEIEDCPVYHCISKFDHPKIKPYLKIFNQAAKNNKQFIIQTLRTDKDPLRRSAAAYLIGHFSDPKEIIQLLEPYMDYPDPMVRNDILRVIGITLLKKPNLPINTQKLISILDSPCGSERNKTLTILEIIAHRPDAKKLLITNAKTELLALLRLKQRNNHVGAYHILKIISGKNYDEYDIESWSKWLNQDVK